MPTVSKQLVASKKTINSNSPEVFYVAPSNQLGTIISNFTASNDTGNTRSYKAYIVVDGGTVDTPVVPNRNIVTNRTDNPPELAGQFIPPGGTLQMETDAGDSISFTVSGREIS